MSLHDPKNTRHARVFELLRRSGDIPRASATHEADPMMVKPVVRPGDLDKLRRAALQSFVPSGAATKSRRNDKLF